ncbi:MAG: hypothetical protein LBB24_01655 [Rickettsiales bacterium]|jgi:hypothetical protein|nr:hypothetical protein [Rickettsiales bacterium]
MFIELDSENNIVAAAEFEFGNNSVETTNEVVRGHDGKLYFSGNEPANDKIAELKERIIFEKQTELERLFYDNYPLHKQCNIGVYGTEEERTAFMEFHNTNVSEFDLFTSQVEGCSTIEELQTYLNN